MPQSRRRARVVAAAVAAAVVVLPAAPAWAHNQVVTTAPGDGAAVDAPIGAVVLRVDHPPLEPLSTSSSIEVTSPGGEVVSGEIAADPPQRLAEPIPVLVRDDDGEWVQDYHFEAYPLRVPLSALPEEGDYTVTYSIADSDGHPTEGSFTFAYTGATGPVPSGAPDPEEGPTLVATASPDEAAAAGVGPDGEPLEPPQADIDAQPGAGAAGEDDAATTPASADEEGDGAAPLLAGAAGLAVLGVGAGYLWRRRHASAAPPPAPRRGQRASARPATSRRSPSAKRPR